MPAHATGQTEKRAIAARFCTECVRLEWGTQLAIANRLAVSHRTISAIFSSHRVPSMLGLAMLAASPVFSKTEPEWRRVMLGLLTLVLFWRYFGAILLGTTKIVADETASRAELEGLRAKLPPQVGVQELELLHAFAGLDAPTKQVMLGAFRDLATGSEPTPPDGSPPAGGWPGKLRLVK